MMKRLLPLLCVLALCLTLVTGCGSQNAAPTQTTGDAPPETTEAANDAWPTGKEALQGKKIIFLGNSYTIWGHTVIYKSPSIITQAERSNDQGYFYQLCKANGIDVNVTNFAFGSHDITDIIGYGPCNAQGTCQDENHQYYLLDPYYDYVAIQCFVEDDYKGDLVAHLQPIVDFFREANPDVKFLLLVPHMACEKEYRWVSDIESLKDENFKICNWGSLCHDLSQGTVQVPGGVLPITRSSFVISKDNHHENVLAGYLTTLMTYCAITGEDPEGQPYDFCSDASINELFDLEAFREKHYPDDPTATNFVEVFQSEADMLGLQKLASQYLAKYNEGN